MLGLFATKGFELVAYLGYSNHAITEKVGESLGGNACFMIICITWYINIILVHFKAIMNSLHTTLTHFEVFITFETWRYSN